MTRQNKTEHDTVITTKTKFEPENSTFKKRKLRKKVNKEKKLIILSMKNKSNKLNI